MTLPHLSWARSVRARALAALLPALTGCRTVVATDLDGSAASHIVTVLSAQGIAGDPVSQSGADRRFHVEVPRFDGSAATALLLRAGLTGTNSAAEPGSSSWIPSRTEEHERRLLSTAGELARSLELIDGVLTARVHIAAPRRDPWRESDSPLPSASVLLRTSPATSADDLSVRGLVAAAVPGLTPDRVTVVRVVVDVPGKAMALVPVGPFSTTAHAAGRLRMAIAAFALANIAFVALVVAAWVRNRRTHAVRGAR